MFVGMVFHMLRWYMIVEARTIRVRYYQRQSKVYCISQFSILNFVRQYSGSLVTRARCHCHCHPSRSVTVMALYLTFNRTQCLPTCLSLAHFPRYFSHSACGSVGDFVQRAFPSRWHRTANASHSILFPSLARDACLVVHLTSSSCDARGEDPPLDPDPKNHQNHPSPALPFTYLDG